MPASLRRVRPVKEVGAEHSNTPASTRAVVAEPHEGAVEEVLDARCRRRGQHADVRNRLIVAGDTEEELPVVGEDCRADT